jgi:hypothetical protein
VLDANELTRKTTEPSRAMGIIPGSKSVYHCAWRDRGGGLVLYIRTILCDRRRKRRGPNMNLAKVNVVAYFEARLYIM